jgi:hypothetical protein
VEKAMDKKICEQANAREGKSHANRSVPPARTDFARFHHRLASAASFLAHF